MKKWFLLWLLATSLLIAFVLKHGKDWKNLYLKPGQEVVE